jgi:hypothetical protein
LIAMKALVVAAAIVVAGCSSSAGPPLSAIPAGPIAVGSPVVAPTLVPTADFATASPTPTTTLAATATPRATPRPTPSFSKAERLILQLLRADARVGCVPKRAGLPARAIAGVECHFDTALVTLVGVYRFRSEDDAVTTYLERLAEYGVRPRTGNCRSGTSGDSSWPGYLPDRADDGGLSPYRSGCFRNEHGLANVRLTCYGGIYMGVVGKSADLAALYKWAWRIAAGESTHRDPPGLCAAPD